MKKIKLTQGQFALVDDDLYEWLNQWKWFYRKRKNRPGGDAVRTLHGYDKEGHVKNKTLYMAHMILPVPPGFVLDHEDVNSLNNQRANLRKATYTNNVHNSGARVTSKSGHKDICWHEASLRWRVQVRTGDKRTCKSFRKEELDKAIAFRDEMIKKYHGKFGRT